MTGIKKHSAAALTAVILATALTIPAAATAAPAESIRVSSYKGSTLEVGERSGLIIGPSGTEYAVTSSDPDTVAVEQVLTFWVAVAKAEGNVEITASNSAGECGSMTLTVSSADSAPLEVPASGDSAGLTANLEIRQEMIWLINQTRKDNGVPELPVSESLMNAAQVCSNRRYTWHHAPEESQAAADVGYPYGFGDNLTVFTGTDNAAQRAVDNWINSPGHFQTMIDPRCDCIGVGVTQYDGITYCLCLSEYPTASTSTHNQTVTKEGRPGSWMAFSHGGRKQSTGRKIQHRGADLLLRYCVPVNKELNPFISPKAVCTSGTAIW